MIEEEFPNHDCDVRATDQKAIDILWYGESQLGKNGRKVIWAQGVNGTLFELVIHGEEEAYPIGIPSPEMKRPRKSPEDETEPAIRRQNLYSYEISLNLKLTHTRIQLKTI